MNCCSIDDEVGEVKMDGVEMEMFAAAIVVLSIALLSPPGTPFRPTKKHQTVTLS
jgi:hypothetical protein